MTVSLDPLSAPRDTSDASGATCRRTGLPLHTACGFSWTQADIDRFMSYTLRRGKCLIWNGAKSRGQGNSQWYGSFYTQGKTVRAHKFYGVAVLGLRPGPGEELDHECNDTLCVHVRILTQLDNAARIRRPTKQILDLARYAQVTPAEIMSLPEEKQASLFRLMEVAKGIEAGFVPHWVKNARKNRARGRRR